MHHPRIGPVATTVVTAALASSLTGLPTARADDWPSLGLDGARTRLSAERSGARFDAGAWQHEWKSAELPSYRALLATPAVGDGYLAFATQRNVVRLLRAHDGQLVWETKAGGAVFASPIIWRGLVFVMGVNQILYALKVSDGSVAWQRDLGAMGYASPEVVEGSLFVATGLPTPRLWRLDAASGETQWQAGAGVLENSALASVAVADGHVLVGQLEGRYFSFASSDGQWQWTAEVGGRVALSSPLVVADRVYLAPGGATARLHALHLATGAAVAGWPLELPMPAVDASLGQPRGRNHVVSSPAGAAEAIVLTVRADDRFGSSPTGDPQSFLSQELLFAVDGAAAKVLWSSPNGRHLGHNANEIPDYELLSTPALHRSGTDELLIAAVSSLAPTVRVLSSNGSERWMAALSAPTRSSPVLANGRLIVATDAGVVHAFQSAINQPPLAPAGGFAPSAGAQTDAARTVLHWDAAVDPDLALASLMPDGQALRYQVRVDDDDELLRNWDWEATVTQAFTQLPALEDGRTYWFAVRARNPQGAWSAWSEPQTFQAIAAPMVVVDDQPVPDLASALLAARPGSVIRLGAGVFNLSGTLQLPAGVGLAGAGPHLTTLRAAGLATAISPGAGSQISQLTVTGAQIGVAVEAPDVQLRNLILQGNADAGLDVGVGGSAHLISATVVGNGTGVRARGTTQLRNTLLNGNDVGLDVSAPATASSRFCNVYGNRVQDFRGASAGATDLAVPVEFEGDGRELRLRPAQPSTDQGDPADAFADEPAPNGGRINIGAFGNTRFAELSGEDPDDPAQAAAGCGCRLGGGAGPGGAGALTLLGFLALVLRGRRRS